MGVRLKLVFNEYERPYLSDITSLLYDFELLHDFSLLLCADDYSNYRFNRLFWYRHGRPIKMDHKIRTVKIVKSSPLEIIVELSRIFYACGAFLTLILIMGKIQSWRLSRKKLELEIEKMKLEIEKMRMELEQKVQEREAYKILPALIKRLESNPIKLKDMEIQYIG